MKEQNKLFSNQIKIKYFVYSFIYIFCFLSFKESEYSSNRLGCFRLGKCLNHHHIAEDLSLNEFSCLELCNQNPLCNWFTFSRENLSCKQFKNCFISDSDICPSCLSGQQFCSFRKRQCWRQGTMFFVGWGAYLRYLPTIFC